MARETENLTRKGFFRYILWTFVCFAVIAALIIAIFSTPFWRAVILCGLLDGFIIIQLFSKSRKYTAIEKIATAIFGIIYTVFSFIGWTKIGWCLLFVYILLCLGTAIYFYCKNREWLSSINVFVGLAAIRLLLRVFRFNYLDGDIKFWLVSLIVAVVATIVSAIIAVRKCLTKRETATAEMQLVVKEKSAAPAVVVLIFMCTFFFFWIGANLLNYALDFSTPISKTYTVIDKKQRNGGKGVTFFDVILSDEHEELTMSVDIYTYKDYEIGEEITISIYQGAFDVAYYLHND